MSTHNFNEAAARHYPIAYGRDPRASETVRTERAQHESGRMPTLPPAVAITHDEDETDLACTD